MEKTEGLQKTIIVIDEQGKIYKSTYPKRAKGLVKSGRARYVDENTICLACPPKIHNLEDFEMNINEIKDNIDVAYIMEKIDAIMEMNTKSLAIDYSKAEVLPGTNHPVVAICETNNKMIDFLNNMYKSLQPKNETIKSIIGALSEGLADAIAMDNNDAVENLSSKLQSLIK